MNTNTSLLLVRIAMTLLLLIPLIITTVHVFKKTRTKYFLFMILSVYGLIAGFFMTQSKPYLFPGIFLLCASVVIASWARKMEDLKKINPDGNIDSKKVFIAEAKHAGTKLQPIFRQMFFTIIGFAILMVIFLAVMEFIRFQTK